MEFNINDILNLFGTERFSEYCSLVIFPFCLSLVINYLFLKYLQYYAVDSQLYLIFVYMCFVIYCLFIVFREHYRRKVQELWDKSASMICSYYAVNKTFNKKKSKFVLPKDHNNFENIRHKVFFIKGFHYIVCFVMSVVMIALMLSPILTYDSKIILLFVFGIAVIYELLFVHKWKFAPPYIIELFLKSRKKQFGVFVKEEKNHIYFIDCDIRKEKKMLITCQIGEVKIPLQELNSYRKISFPIVFEISLPEKANHHNIS
ncbi:MAG: hypothetical protein PHH82_01765 [Candidatus ainarchaeum sp.]|nr:hypothetical protein [Candidatus ainarchaeum sp.]